MTSVSTPPRGVHICVSAILPTSAGRRLAHSRSSSASAPSPLTTNLAKLVWSSTPTPPRTARHSSPTASNQLPRANEYSSTAGPAFANQRGRSHPDRTPITAPFATRRSCSGSVLSGRPAGRSSSGKWILYSSSNTSDARSTTYDVDRA